MRPVSVVSDLPSYAHLDHTSLPSYAEQWHEASVTRPVQAHIALGDLFDAGPRLELGQMAAQAPMQLSAPSSRPVHRRPVQNSVDACMAGCINCCSFSSVVGAVVIAGFVIIIAGYVNDAATTRGIGGGVIGVGIVGAIAYRQYSKRS